MAHIKPHRLYKYKSLSREIDVDRVVQIIENATIFTTPIKMLNDPFEGLGVTPGPGSGYAGVGFPKALEKTPLHYKKDLSTCRIISLTENPVSPQMWAYYADNYTGVCLQLDPSILDVEPMRYAAKPYRVDGVRLDGIDGDLLTRARLLSKHIDWSHEQEWRAIYEGDGCPEYVKLGEGNPNAVILGHQCAREHAKRIRAVCEKMSIPVYETYISDWKYCVRIVPAGFRGEYSGVPLYRQVLEECNRQGIPMFEDW